MLNRSGITTTQYGAPRQILANVEHQASVGCIVPSTLVPTANANGKKIAKAGTPIHIDLENLQTPVAAVASGSALNAVLLHDVDVTAGNANGTALYFGMINLNRLESDVVTALTTARAVSGASPLLVFLKA